MNIYNLNMVLAMMCLLAMATALPQNVSVNLDNNVNNVTNVHHRPTQIKPSFRQARADLNSIARFITPDNIAQMKSLFSGIQHYGSTGLSNALTFNVGSLVVLTLIAGLALLIAPTVLGLFGLGGFGANLGRSLGLTNEQGQLFNTERVYRALDTFFQDYNIDAKTCLQRYACSASRKTSTAVRDGNPSYMDSALNYLLESTYMTTVLDKTSMLDAVNYGKSGGDCEIEYGKCPFSWEKVSQYLPFNGIKLASPFFGAGATPFTDSTSNKLPVQPPTNK